MKKNFLTIVLMFFVTLANAQFYAGGVFSENSTWLLNKAVFDRGASQDIAASFGNNYGIVAGFKFNENYGVEINFLFNKHTQKYVGNFICDYNSISTYNSIDIPILLKLGEGAFFEVGPVFSLMQNAHFKIEYDGTICPGNEDRDNREDYVNTFFGAAMGFGGNISLTDNLKISLGLRLYYGFTDIGGVNALGWNKEKTEQMDNAYNILYPNDDNHYGHKDFKTNPASGGLRIGIIYVID